MAQTVEGLCKDLNLASWVDCPDPTVEGGKRAPKVALWPTSTQMLRCTHPCTCTHKPNRHRVIVNSIKWFRSAGCEQSFSHLTLADYFCPGHWSLMSWVRILEILSSHGFILRRVYFICMKLCDPEWVRARHVFVKKKARDYQNRNGRRLWADVWVLGTKPEPSARTALALFSSRLHVLSSWLNQFYWLETIQCGRKWKCSGSYTIVLNQIKHFKWFLCHIWRVCWCV